MEKQTQMYEHMMEKSFSVVSDPCVWGMETDVHFPLREQKNVFSFYLFFIYSTTYGFYIILA